MSPETKVLVIPPLFWAPYLVFMVKANSGFLHFKVDRKKVKVSESCLILCNPMGLYSSWNSPGQNTGVGSLSLLWGFFPNQGSNPGLPRCRQILYQLSQKGSPRIREWVSYPFSSRSSLPRKQTTVPALQVDSLPSELSGKPEPRETYTKTYHN